MKATVSVLLALLMLASPLAVLSTAQEDEIVIDRDLQVDVTTGSTERFGGGDWIRVDVGSTTFAVLYGNETNPNFPKIIAEYDRYLGAAEVYNESGGIVHETTPLPVRTIMAQSFELMVEFKDDGDGVLRFPTNWEDFLFETYDVPRKVVVLKESWELWGLEIDESDELTTVDFSISATGLPYHMVGPFGDEGDGLDNITFSFHIRIELVETTLDVPVYRIIVNEDRQIVGFTKRIVNVTGMTVNGTFKYDHYIEGWDWGDADSLLAMSTHVFVGNFVPEPVLRFLHLEFALRALEDGGEHREDSIGDRPLLITADKLEFEDEWERIGRIRWVSDVEVTDDQGVTETMEMYFQLHGALRVSERGLRGLFGGVLFRGAFIYPQGTVIFHDPALDASVFVPGGQLVSGVVAGLGPYFIQAAVAGLVIVGLVLFRTLRRKPEN